MTRRDFLTLATVGGAQLLAGADLGRAAGAPRSVHSLDQRAIRDFASSVHGTVIYPSDSNYDVARRIWNGRFDRRPELIVRCADAGDVKRTVDFARAEKLLVAVRGGGHSFAGHSVCDGGIVIDLSVMKGVEIDARQRVVRVEPGLVVRELDSATQKAGLAMVLGGCGSVGIGGFTLGGGEGALCGKYGLSCDNLLSAEAVLADGRRVTASADDNADLFWALRGGGGNFGVVTSFRLRAHPLTQVMAGRLIYDLGEASRVMRAYREFATSAPDELTAGFAFGTKEKGPELALDILYAGDPQSAAPVLRRLRSLANVRADTIALVSYHEYRLATPAIPAGFPTLTRGAFLPELPDEVIAALVALGAEITPAADLELFHIHGAVSRVPLGDTAFPLRQPGYDCFAIGGWLAPAQRDAVVRWVERFWDAVRPYARGVYVNELADDEGDRVESAYGKQYPRLAALKKKYDPDNFFRMNPNIVPAQ
jgi:FAD/FMN-containing dehydrogenase